MSCVKRGNSSNVVLASKSIILDIEGTTSSIAFVKDVLFPYVRENLQDYIKNRWDSDSFQETVNALRNQAKEDELNHMDGVVIIPENGAKEEMIEAVTKNVFWLMDSDRKTKSLKDIQGLIMEEGYLKGNLHGHVYDDVGECLKSWKVQDKSVYIYSSGSVHAQKLLFGHSIKGDLLKFISGHFDTSVGPKGESTSYKKILEEISCSPNEAVFLTDVPQEARAAKEAGLSAVLLSREGNAPLTDEDKAMFPVISNFEVIEFESNSKKLKLCNDTDVNIEENKVVYNCPVSDDIQANSDNPNSDGDVQMAVDQDDCESMKHKNNGEVVEQLCQESEVDLVKLDTSSMQTCNSDERMFEVQAFSENKEDDLKEDNDVQIHNHVAKVSGKSDIPSNVNMIEVHEQKSSPQQINNPVVGRENEKNLEDDSQEDLLECSRHKEDDLESLVNGKKGNVTKLDEADLAVNIKGSKVETSEENATPDMSPVNNEKLSVNLNLKGLEPGLTSQCQASSEHSKCEKDVGSSDMSKLNGCGQAQAKLDNAISESIETKLAPKIKVDQINNSHEVSEGLPVKCSIKLSESNKILKSQLETDEKVLESMVLNGDSDKAPVKETSDGMPKVCEITLGLNDEKQSKPILESAEEGEKSIQESLSKSITEVKDTKCDDPTQKITKDIAKNEIHKVITTNEETNESIIGNAGREEKIQHTVDNHIHKETCNDSDVNITCDRSKTDTPKTAKQLESKQSIETEVPNVTPISSKDSLDEKKHSDLSINGKLDDIKVQDKCDTNGKSDVTEVNDILGEMKSEGNGDLNDFQDVQEGNKSASSECSNLEAIVEA